MEFTGKKIIVTGGSRGIGQATAIAFARAGASVAITARSADALTETVEQIRNEDGIVHPIVWDLADIPNLETRLDEVCDELGGLDILVNNAGVHKLPPDSPGYSPAADWDFVMTINLKSVYFLCEAAGKLMQEGGIIINLSSDAGMRAAAHPYGISKWGVIGLTKGFAHKYSGAGIRVNAIAPGPVATRMMGCPDGVPRESNRHPMGRFALPEEIADIALYLAGEHSKAIIGQTLVANTANS